MYHKDTVLVQGSENCLDNFQNTFQSMKEEAENKETGSSIHSEADKAGKTEDIITSSNPSSILSPYTTPKFSNSLRTLKEGFPVLKREFMEFRGRTFASLHQKTSDDQPKTVTHTPILQQRDQIKELQRAIRDVQDNQSLTNLSQPKQNLARPERGTS